MCQTDKSSGRLVATCLSLWLCFDAHAAQPGTTEDQTLAEVIVTGTRLAVTQADTTAPVTVLDRRDLERGGKDSIGKVVQTLPMNTGSPLNTNVNNGGDGSTRVDLRGLGSDRTLVLLNGRRFPNGGIGGDASVDLNTLPVSWIERIEVLASGASAVYGADAVGGVVNVITRGAYDGVELSGNWTMTERGDGQIVRGQAAIGFDLFGGNWVSASSTWSRTASSSIGAATLQSLSSSWTTTEMSGTAARWRIRTGSLRCLLRTF
jgi:outer membrane cobalamin receptor